MASTKSLKADVRQTTNFIVRYFVLYWPIFFGDIRTNFTGEFIADKIDRFYRSSAIGLRSTQYFEKADDIGTYASANIIQWYSHLCKKRHLANMRQE